MFRRNFKSILLIFLRNIVYHGEVIYRDCGYVNALNGKYRQSFSFTKNSEKYMLLDMTEKITLSAILCGSFCDIDFVLE